MQIKLKKTIGRNESKNQQQHRKMDKKDRVTFSYVFFFIHETLCCSVFELVYKYELRYQLRMYFRYAYIEWNASIWTKTKNVNK